MMDWILENLPYVRDNQLLVGTFLIVITSILFLIKIDTVSDKIDDNQKDLAGDSDNVLTKLLLPLCTALPNFIFAFSALKSPTSSYLVITSNVGNNVTNITLFAGLILFIGFIKGESLNKEEGLSLRKDYIFLTISTIIFFVCIWDLKVTRHEGIILTLCFLYSMAGVFKFQLKDLYIIVSILIKLAPFFVLAGFFIFIGSELIVSELEELSKNGNSGLYEVLLPGLVLVLPSTLPLLLTIAKPSMQKIALSGIIGDSAFSIPLIIGIISCFSNEISLQKASNLFDYLLISTIIAFVCFYISAPSSEKGKTPFWKIFVPFVGYAIIVFLSMKGK